MTSEKMFNIITKDKQIIAVSEEIRGMSRLIDEWLYSFEESEPYETKCLELVETESKTINLVLEYCQHFNFSKFNSDIKKPLISNDPKVYINDDWEREFITKLNLDEHFELLMAVHKLDIPAM